MSADLGKPHSPPRRARRFPADLLPTLKATILAGPDVRVINVSKFGMLIESDVRLSPNASVCLNITLDGRTFPASGRVLRVDAALSGGRVKYRAGVQLDSEVAAFDLSALEDTQAHGAPAHPEAAPAKAAAPAQPQTRPPAQPQTRPSAQTQASAPAQAPPARAAGPADAAAAQQVQETLQLLRTALQTSEAQRKELAAALETDRAAWEEQRHQLEQAVAQAKQSADSVQKQVSSAQKDSAAAQKELAAAQKDLTAAQREAADARRELTAAREELTAAQKQASAIKDAEKSHARAQAAWDAERTAFEKRSKEVDARASQLMKELREAAERERSLQSQYGEAKAQWDRERRELQRAVDDVTARADRASRELTNARENEKRLSRKIDEQAESIDAFLADKRRMESEIEALRAAATVAEEAAGAYEQERAEWTEHKQHMTERLELTEKLCTDQRDLLFHLRQQIGEAFALIDSWEPQDEAGGEQQPSGDGESKISAVQRLRKIIG